MNHFSNFADFFASTLPALGAGTRWTVEGGYVYQEAESTATDHDVTNASSVKFYVESSPFGPPQDIQFGLVDDPGLTIDQTTEFEAFIAKGGELLVTAGNSYKLTTADDIPTTTGLAIKPTEPGSFCKLVGVDGKRMLKPTHSVSLSGLEVTGFSELCNMVSTTDIPLFEIRNCHVHDQDYLSEGTFSCDEYVVEDNLFEGFTSGLISHGTMTVRRRQSFCRNRVDDVARYVYRVSAEAVLYFQDNHITNVHSGAFTGTSGVVRIIQRGSEISNVVTGNTCLDAVSSTAACVFVYWSYGDLVFSNNVLGGFKSTDDDCYIIQEKSVLEKSLVMHDNSFIGGAGDDTDACEVEYAVYLLTSRENQQRPRSIQGNVIETLKGKFVTVFDNDTLTDTEEFTSENLDSEPCSVTVQGNILYNLQSSAFVAVSQGVWGLSVLNNQCWNHNNPDSDGQLGGTESTKSIISLSSTAVNATMKNVVCAGNNWRFTNLDESPAAIGAISYATALNANSEMELVVTNNIITGADHYHSHRNKQGTFNLAIRNNTMIGGITGSDIEGASVGDGISELLDTDNATLG